MAAACMHQPDCRECRLDQDDFNEFWLRLLAVIDDAEDRLVAYRIDARSAREICTAGAISYGVQCDAPEAGVVRYVADGPEGGRFRRDA
jgi:hypothetical protein